jgi:glycosyltransferase involved in cell wall biosynthesis
MSERNVLIVSYHFPPSAATGTLRVLGLVRHLAAFGWRAVVVAPPSLPWEPIDEALTAQLPDSVRIYPTPYPSSGFLTRAARHLLGPYPVWLWPALRSCERALREQRIDAVITTSPPHVLHFLGLALKRRHKIFWIADFRDPWATVANGTTARATGLSRHGECAVFRAADRVVANTPRVAAAFRQAYPQRAERIVAITNGFDPELFPDTPRSLEGPVRVLHTGELYAGRDPRSFLEAIRLLREDKSFTPSIEATFLGRNTEGKFDLATEIQNRNLQDVIHIGGQVPYLQSLRHMTEADILLLLEGKGRPNMVPAKLYEYLGARRPILALADPDSDTEWVLRTSGVPHRLVPPPGDPLAIKVALGELMGELRAGQFATAPERVRQFTREHMAAQFARLLDEGTGSLVEKTRAPGSIRVSQS